MFIFTKRKSLSVTVALLLGGNSACSYAGDGVQFNVDVIDVKDRSNIDLGKFSHAGYIMPGKYELNVHVNNQELPDEYVIEFSAKPTDPNVSLPCLTPEIAQQLGFKSHNYKELKWLNNGKCLDISSAQGMTVTGNLATSALDISIPQAYLEFSSPDWDPPSRWDKGINGALFDYNLNAKTTWQNNDYSDGNDRSISGNGTAGFNIGAWRFRADWQANFEHTDNNKESAQKTWDWSRYYAYRPIPNIGAKLTVGDDYLASDVFDNFRFVGASLNSDDEMLPPNLRGYAPEITGVARTNAKITISQQGRVLSETQVPAGPFRIQNISDSVTGKLDVKIEEQDGKTQIYQVETANIPYLTRPGMLRYKLSVGKPRYYEYSDDDDGNDSYDYSDYGPSFGLGEFSWGVTNGWSLYGGAIGGRDYNSLSVGVGRDMLALGAAALDLTGSHANLPGSDTDNGLSVKFSYSKSFDDYDSQVTFAGYRFSQKGFMTMSEYLDARQGNDHQGNSKQRYTVSFNKQFKTLDMNLYLNLSHETYWDRPENNNYNVSVSRTFDAFGYRNLSMSLTAFKNRYYDTDDLGAYLSLSVPIGNNSSVGFNSSLADNDTTNSVDYHHRLDDHNDYQLSVGESRNGANMSGYYTYLGDSAEVDGNIDYRENDYSSLGLNLKGGVTATSKGVALHRLNVMGGTRLMLDTGGVANVPVEESGASMNTNAMGLAVIGDMNSYYRSRANVDLTDLDDNVEVTNSVVQATLTEGAIGYRHFSVISGEKAMAVIRLSDGSSPPFGASVINSDNQETGIVNDDGNVYLSGINADEKMNVQWNGTTQCVIDFPHSLPHNLSVGDSRNLLLTCKRVSDTGN